MMASRRGVAGALAWLLAVCAPGAGAQQPTPEAPVATRNGLEIYARFREGLADPICDPQTSARWRAHFATTPTRLVSRDNNILPLFGYVVDALRAASLPTEYALIPFVESGYKPGARSAAGPAGLWQMIAVTARNHHVAIQPGYDGRLSPVESTQAAVRYLKTLHGMFAGDWRLAVMAYNAGEYRVFDALKRSGQVARSASPDKLVGLSGISKAYVRKLHALSCVLDRADDRDGWKQALDRPVPLLEAVRLPQGTSSLDAWSATSGRDVAAVRRLNPAFAGGRVTSTRGGVQILAPMVRSLGAALDASRATDPVEVVVEAGSAPKADHAVTGRTHTVARGESPWMIARHYDLQVADLLARNGLASGSVLQPGMVLELDTQAPGE
jgi:membrane-bound lytic murein transglycosylase D